MNWRFEAACREADPELFFPIGSSGPALRQVQDAKALCSRCPVLEQCRQWALDYGEVAGVWGALSEDERRAIKHADARKRYRRVAQRRSSKNHAP